MLRVNQLIGFGERRISGSSGWTPASLGSTLKGWYRGDLITGSNGDAISPWADSSGNAYDMTQATSGRRPNLVTAGLNSLNILRFTPSPGGSEDYYEVPTALFSGLTAGALFVVMKKAADPATNNAKSGYHNLTGDVSSTASHMPYSDGNVYDGFGTTSRRNLGNPTPSLASWRIVSHHAASADLRCYIDGTVFASSGTNTVGFNTTNPRFGWGTGGAGDVFMDADVAEVLLCSAALTTLERQKVEGYEAYKWGLQGNLDAGHPYKSSPP